MAPDKDIVSADNPADLSRIRDPAVGQFFERVALILPPLCVSLHDSCNLVKFGFPRHPSNLHKLVS